MAGLKMTTAVLQNAVKILHFISRASGVNRYRLPNCRQSQFKTATLKNGEHVDLEECKCRDQHFPWHKVELVNLIMVLHVDKTGVDNLLPELENAISNCAVADFKGKKVGVDAYSWLYDGACKVAEKLFNGQATQSYVDSSLRCLTMLLNKNITPIFVFEGRPLPAKAAEHAERAARKKGHLRRAEQFKKAGNMKDALTEFRASIEVTPEMTAKLVAELRKRKLDYIVAPFEANAQLAYLASSGQVDLVITENADLVIYGVEQIIFKFHPFKGAGKLYERSKLATCFNVREEEFSFTHFRWMCILAGCDFQKAICEMEIKRAKEMVFASRPKDIDKLLEYVSKKLGPARVPLDYFSGFKQAEATFLYQLIFDPLTSAGGPLNEYAEGVDPASLSFAGTMLEPETNIGIALGNVCPLTLMVTGYFDPMRMGYPKTSIWRNLPPQRQPPSSYSSDDSAFKDKPRKYKAKAEKPETVPTFQVAPKDKEISMPSGLDERERSQTLAENELSAPVSNSDEVVSEPDGSIHGMTDSSESSDSVKSQKLANCHQVNLATRALSTPQDSEPEALDRRTNLPESAPFTLAKEQILPGRCPVLHGASVAKDTTENLEKSRCDFENTGQTPDKIPAESKQKAGEQSEKAETLEESKVLSKNPKPSATSDQRVNPSRRRFGLSRGPRRIDQKGPVTKDLEDKITRKPN